MEKYFCSWSLLVSLLPACHWASSASGDPNLPTPQFPRPPHKVQGVTYNEQRAKINLYLLPHPTHPTHHHVVYARCSVTVKKGSHARCGVRRAESTTQGHEGACSQACNPKAAGAGGGQEACPGGCAPLSRCLGRLRSWWAVCRLGQG